MSSLIYFIPRDVTPIVLQVENTDVGFDMIKWIVMHNTNNLKHMMNIYRLHARHKYNQNYKLCDINTFPVKINWRYIVSETNQRVYVRGYNYVKPAEIFGAPEELFNKFLSRV